MIFYFSGTGNTRWVARQLAEALGEQLTDIAKELADSRLNYTLDKDERIGFCFPTHGWQPPKIVRTFIRRMVLNSTTGNVGNHFCWALTTCGDNMGEAMTILNRELAKKGLTAETQFSVIMPESYVCLPFMYTDTDQRVAEKMTEARRQLQHITDTLKNRQRGIVELEKGATPRLYSYVLGGYFNKHMISDRKFTVDEAVCTHCGRCAKVCPTGDIEGVPPHWLHDGRCTCCLACYHHCPVHAINYGKITRKRGQYHLE